MSLESPERRPKEHIEDTRDRFMDFVGNAINAVLGAYDNLNEKGFSEEAKARTVVYLKDSWRRFFASVEMFMENDFQPTEAITRERLEEILLHRDEDPLVKGVVEKVDDLYRSICKKE